MPFNGSGTFVPISAPNYPAVAGQPVYASQFNANMTDLFSGFDNCVTRDGQSPATADIPMGSNKLTGLAQASANGDALGWGQAANVTALTATGDITAPNFYVGATSAGAGTFGLATANGAGVVAYGDTHAANGVLEFYTGQSRAIQVLRQTSAVNYLGIQAAATTAAVSLIATGTDANVSLQHINKGLGGFLFQSNYGAALTQFAITATASANRWLSVTGSNGGNPALSASGGSIALGSDVQGSTATFSGAIAAASIALGGGTALANYLEGTFTPTIAFSGAAVGVTYTTQSGAYTRIGNRVFFELRCFVSSKGSSVGNLQILGLPLAANGGGPSREQIVQLDYTGFSGLTGAMYGIIISGQTQVTVLQTAAAAAANVTNSSVGASPDIYISGSYHV